MTRPKNQTVPPQALGDVTRALARVRSASSILVGERKALAKEIRRLVADGYTYSAIARGLGMSRQRLHEFMRWL